MTGSKVEIKGFPAKITALYDMLAFVREEAGLAGFSPQDIPKIELAAEEALVNIISYGYPTECAGNPSIEIESSYLSEGGIRLQIRDQGIPYNPLENKTTYNPASTDDNVGGYGIFFITNLMDEVTYTREQSTNLLTLIKFIRP
jgi:serine/threonine-protein kinase RsbW